MENKLLNLKIEPLEEVHSLLSTQDNGIITGFIAFNVVSAVIVGGIMLT